MTVVTDEKKKRGKYKRKRRISSIPGLTVKKYFFHPKFKTNRSFNVNTRILKQHGFVNTAETHCIKERNVLLDEEKLLKY